MSLSRRSLLLRGVLAGGLGVPAAAATASPLTALDFSGDGALLAVAGYRQILLVDVAAGEVRRRLPCRMAISALRFDRPGRQFAAGGGEPGRGAELHVWRLGGGPARVLRGGHTDAILSLDWHPDGRTIAASSYDRLVSLRQLDSSAARLLKDHTDAVYSIAFDRSGDRLASASGDRTVKVWAPAQGKRLFTLSEATAELYSVAFHPERQELSAGGVDRMLRSWQLTPNSGALLRAAFAHDGPVLCVRYDAAGSIWTASEDRTVKAWDPVTLTERRVLPRQSDWPAAIATSRDGRWFATARHDGSLATYAADTGKLKWETKPR